jgi:hypothetical protein
MDINVSLNLRWRVPQVIEKNRHLVYEDFLNILAAVCD